MPKFLLLPLALLAQQNPSVAAPPELVTDRPDFTESATTVPSGSIQIEMGSTWTRSAGLSTVSGGEALARWGLAELLEARVGLPDLVRTGGVSGITDASLGLKLALGVHGPWEAAVLSDVAVPTGDSTYGADGAEGSLILTFGRDLGERWSFGTQVSGAWGTNPKAVTVGSTVVVGMGVSERLGAFAELALDGWEDTRRAVTLHHGYSYLLSPTLQVDLHGGVGLSDAAPDGLLGIGLSTRLRDTPGGR